MRVSPPRHEGVARGGASRSRVQRGQEMGHGSSSLGHRARCAPTRLSRAPADTGPRLRDRGARAERHAGLPRCWLERTDIDQTVLRSFGANTRRSRQRIVHKFCRYRRRSDPNCFVPDPLYFARPQPCRRRSSSNPSWSPGCWRARPRSLPRRTRRYARWSCAWRLCSSTRPGCAAAKCCV